MVQRAEPRLRDALGADAPIYLNVLRLRAWLSKPDPPSSAAKQTVSSTPRDLRVDRDTRLIFN